MAQHNNVGEALQEYQNTLILANAVQLGVDAIREIAGNDIATGIGSGEEKTPETTEAQLNHTLAAKINSHLMSE